MPFYNVIMLNPVKSMEKELAIEDQLYKLFKPVNEKYMDEIKILYIRNMLLVKN